MQKTESPSFGGTTAENKSHDGGRRRFAMYAWAVLGWNLLVIVWGAFVRATGSGAGCGDHWPLCNGEVLPRSAKVETLIEFTHRVTSGMALIAVVFLIIWAFRAYPARHRVRLAATASLFFIITEALLGAGLVLFRYVAGNASVMRAFYLSAHLINTLLLLAAISLTAWWASGGREVILRNQGRMLWILGIGFAGALLLGVSGAVTALGDTLFPASSLTAGLRQDFSPAANLLLRLRVFHPFLAVLVCSYLVIAAILATIRRGGLATKRLAWILAALVVTQLIAGVVNLLLLAPVWMQLLHLFLADMLWISFVLLAAAALAQALPTRATALP